LLNLLILIVGILLIIITKFSLKMMTLRKEIDKVLLSYASVLDNRYRIIETIGEGRYAKFFLTEE